MRYEKNRPDSVNGANGANRADSFDGSDDPNALDELDDLGRILASEEPLTPSSGFAAAVMESVREAAAEPAPLPFPWKRFAAYAIICAVWAAASAALIATLDFAAAREMMTSLGAAGPELGYAAAAVLGTIVVLRLPRSRARRG